MPLYTLYFNLNLPYALRPTPPPPTALMRCISALRLCVNASNTLSPGVLWFALLLLFYKLFFAV